MPLSVLPKILAVGTERMREDVAGLVHFIADCRRARIMSEPRHARHKKLGTDPLVMLSSMLTVMPADNPHVRWLIESTIAES